MCPGCKDRGGGQESVKTAFVKEVALSSEGNLQGKCTVRGKGTGC